MHIALVSYEFPPENATGGIGSYMYHLSSILGCAGHRVTVFSANPAATDVVVLQQGHYTNYLVPAVDNESFRKAVVPVFTSIVLSNKVDVIESPEVGACALHIKENFPQIPML